MSEATHTPGPWEYLTELHPNSRLADSGILGYRIRGADQGLLTTIAEIFPQAYPVAVNDANARLIAAAPELLAALENLLEYADNYSNELAKEGRGAYQLGKLADAVSVSGMARAAIAKARGI